MCIAGHHAGLPNFGTRGEVVGASFMARLNRYKQDRSCIPSIDKATWKSELPELEQVSCSPAPQSDKLTMAFRCHFLYSCLVDADFLDTEAFMRGLPYAHVKSDFRMLAQRLHDFVEANFQSDNALNAERSKILHQCKKMGETAQRGLYTLTVPTGGGKTLSSLTFALEHAVKHELSRIIYVVPYTSIVEQNAAVFRAILGDDAVLEHHSNVVYDIEEESNPDNIRKARACENWNSPIIVTTAVQFFESLFANRSSKSRKVHNLANSVVVFDEAQMLSIDFLKPCVFAIAQLVQHYGATAVLCTATQPALNKMFASYQLAPVELCPAELFRGEVFRRVTFVRSGKISWAELAEQLVAHQQALCVVNSRRNAKDLFRVLKERLPDSDGVFHLSTLMCPVHRQKVLQTVRQYLAEGKQCLVVSTSLIEAGVDIDFSVVFKELAGLDSILQAAGRCNREGKRKQQESLVTVFEAEMPPPRIFAQPIAATRSLLCQEQDELRWETQEAMRFYYNELLELKGAERLDAHNILDLLERSCHADVGERFHLIDGQCTVYVPFDLEGEQLIGRYKEDLFSRELLRNLARFSVSVYPAHFQQLVESGALQMVDAQSGTGVLDNANLYSLDCGLDMEADSGQALFI